MLGLTFLGRTCQAEFSELLFRLIALTRNQNFVLMNGWRGSTSPPILLKIGPS
jgi:hypothetical protein